MSILTSQDCLTKFGDPTANERKFMVVLDIPTHLEVGFIPKKLYCNKAMQKPFLAAITALITTGAVKELKTFDGCFNIRKKRGGTTMSLHSWGVAVDVNANWNRMGEPPTLSKKFVKCFTDNGFDWGGDWKKPDGMHFQLKRESL
jgi:hypothetical protein